LEREKRELEREKRERTREADSLRRERDSAREVVVELRVQLARLRGGPGGYFPGLGGGPFGGYF